MGDTNLHGVLRMPPDCWSGTELDVTQRHSRYLQASDKIYELQDELLEIRAKIPDLIEVAFMAGQADCGVDPSHASAQEYAKTFLKSKNGSEI